MPERALCLESEDITSILALTDQVVVNVAFK